MMQFNLLKKNKYRKTIGKSCLVIITGVLLPFMLLTVTKVQAAEAQSKRVSIQKDDISLADVFREIRKQTGYNFIFSNKVMKKSTKTSLHMNEAGVFEVLDKALENQPLTYTVEDNMILLEEKEVLSALRAPSEEITGRVTDMETGEPLAGVSIRVKNTNIGTLTDEQGYFSLTTESNATILVSFIGYGTQEIQLDQQTEMNIQLSTSATGLDQVVVVGYGQSTERTLTNAITKVDMSALQDRPLADVGRGLQGTVPGLSVRIPSGEVGSDPLIRIRGFVGSIQGSSEPLILVDNVEIPSIQLVNPNDIESISILKDAAATSIYGSKAAFGVVLITTKKGDGAQGNTVTYSNNFSFQTPWKKMELAGIHGLEYTLDAQRNRKLTTAAGGFWRIDEESVEKAKQWQELYGGTVKPSDPVLYGRDWILKGGEKFGYRIYDPLEMMVKDYAFTQDHNLSLNGGSGSTNYNVSLGYMGQNGMMKPAPHDDYKRYTGKLNISTQATDFLKIRGGILFTDRMKRYPNSTNDAGFAADPWLYTYRWSSVFPIGVKEHGDVIRDPYWDTRNTNTNKLGNRYTNLNFGADLNLTKNWTIKGDYAYDIRSTNEFSSLPIMEGRWHWYGVDPWVDENGNQIFVDSTGMPTDVGGMEAYQFPYTMYVGPQDTYLSTSNTQAFRHTVNAYTTYDLDIREDHHFKFMLGTNIVAYKWSSFSARKGELINNDNPQYNFAVGTETTGGGANWESQVGNFGRLNYNYKGKYLFEGNLRYDGTSKFPDYIRWRWFPSFSAGWVLTEENFMEPTREVLSFAKFRGSWGSIGDQSVPNSLYLSTMGISRGNWLDPEGTQLFQLGTPGPISRDITWQDIETLDFGLDVRMFKDKLGFVFDWYERKTQNMIIPGLSMPATFGAGAPQGNYGNLRTRGWELEADFAHRFDNGIGLHVRANISDATTYITKGPDWDVPYENRSIGSTFATGKRYGDLYGYVTDRLYQKEDFVYDDNGDFEQTTIIWEGTAKVTNKQAGDNPVYQTNFEDGNQILLIAPGDVKFVDVNGDGYITAGKGTFGDPGDRVVIGNTLPRYEYGMRIALDYKSFDISIMGQGVGKRTIWGDGQLAVAGYNAKEGGMPEAIVSNYWREDRTDAFYPRAWDLGNSNSGFTMVPQTKYALNMAYFRIKNLTIGYTMAPKILERVRLKQARIFLSLDNLFTMDHLRGLPIDPEAISGFSMLAGNYNLGRTGTSNPTFKSLSFGLNISF